MDTQPVFGSSSTHVSDAETRVIMFKHTQVMVMYSHCEQREEQTLQLGAKGTQREAHKQLLLLIVKARCVTECSQFLWVRHYKSWLLYQSIFQQLDSTLKVFVLVLFPTQFGRFGLCQV